MKYIKFKKYSLFRKSGEPVHRVKLLYKDGSYEALCGSNLGPGEKWAITRDAQTNLCPSCLTLFKHWQKVTNLAKAKKRLTSYRTKLHNRAVDCEKYMECLKLYEKTNEETFHCPCSSYKSKGGFAGQKELRKILFKGGKV